VRVFHRNECLNRKDACSTLNADRLPSASSPPHQQQTERPCGSPLVCPGIISTPAWQQHQHHQDLHKLKGVVIAQWGGWLRSRGRRGGERGRKQKRGVVACGDREQLPNCAREFCCTWCAGVPVCISPSFAFILLSSSRFSLHSLDTITDTQRQQACLPVSFLALRGRLLAVDEPLPSHDSVVLYYHSRTYPSMPSPFCWTSPHCIYAFSITRCRSSSSRPAPFVRPKPS